MRSIAEDATAVTFRLVVLRFRFLSLKWFVNPFLRRFALAVSMTLCEINLAALEIASAIAGLTKVVTETLEKHHE